jgi:hypothetical protein
VEYPTRRNKDLQGIKPHEIKICGNQIPRNTAPSGITAYDKKDLQEIRPFETKISRVSGHKDLGISDPAEQCSAGYQSPRNKDRALSPPVLAGQSSAGFHTLWNHILLSIRPAAQRSRHVSPLIWGPTLENNRRSIDDNSGGCISHSTYSFQTFIF